jgi:hypothetical protein
MLRHFFAARRPTAIGRMTSLLRIPVWLLAIAWLTGAPAHAEHRVALVIGNSNYRAVSVLPNPVNDAKAIADLLRGAGFDVTAATDLAQADMRHAIKDFAGRIAQAGPDTVALVFYAGHGLQVDGENFLVPVDARIADQADVAAQAVRLADLMTALAAVPVKMRIVILDACRNNPFSQAKQVGGRGLAIVDAPTGSIVAYSTAPGTEAIDGTGVNSPYTAAFLEVARQPQLPIEQLFKQVRLKVHQATGGQQTPWESSSLTSDFSFLPYDAAPSSTAVATNALPAKEQVAATRLPTMQPLPTNLPPLPKAADANASASLPPPSPPSATATASSPGSARPAAQSPRVSRVSDIRTLPPREAYELAVEEDTVEAYEEFLLNYPSDPLADLVRVMLARRVDAIAWRYAVVVNTPAAYDAYLASYPGGIYAAEALRLRARPRVHALDPVIAPPLVAPPRLPRVPLPLIQAQRQPAPVLPAALPQLPAGTTTLLPARRGPAAAPPQVLPTVPSRLPPATNAVHAPPRPDAGPLRGPAGTASAARAASLPQARPVPPWRSAMRPGEPPFRPLARAQMGPRAPQARCAVIGGRQVCRR